MKTFKQFNEESRMHLDEVDRNMMGLGTGLNLLAKGVGGLYKAGKFVTYDAPKFGFKKVVVPVAKKVVQPVMLIKLMVRHYMVWEHIRVLKVFCKENQEKH